MADAKELLKAAKQQQQAVINDLRVNLLAALAEMEDIGGSDSYESGVEAVLAASSGTMMLSSMREVLPDAERLTKARKELKRLGRITESEENKKISIVLVTPPSAPLDGIPA